MSLGGAKASQADKQREFEREMTKTILDWISVVRPESGNVLVLRIPDEYYVEPETPVDQVSDVKQAVYKQIGVIFDALINGLNAQGVKMAGAAVLREDMRIEDLPPPPQPGQPGRSKAGLILPPGVR